MRNGGKDEKNSDNAFYSSDGSFSPSWLREKAELSVWLPWSNDYIESPEELIAVQKIEEATNVHIDWTTVSDMEASEKLELLLASGSYSVGSKIQELVDNGTYPSLMDALFATYTLGNQEPGRFNSAKADVFTEVPISATTRERWNQADEGLLLLEKLTMTEEESIAFYSKYTDIQTLVEENTVQFIIGSKPMEDYDSFLVQLSQYGGEECIQYKQNALNRFQAR